LGDLGPGEVRDETDPVSHPIKAVVMKGDDHTIGGDMGIGLDITETEFDCPREGFE
jgi:hypothetical protein